MNWPEVICFRKKNIISYIIDIPKFLIIVKILYFGVTFLYNDIIAILLQKFAFSRPTIDLHKLIIIAKVRIIINSIIQYKDSSTVQ